MSRLRLIHWNTAEGRERATRLRNLGHTVAFRVPAHGGDLTQYGKRPPDAFVIDLARLPSHGREVGCALRSQTSTRRTPLVFVGGAPEKVERVRAVLPDAVFTSWRGVAGALERAIETPPAEPVVPGRLAGYSNTPLPKKLGIKPGATLMLLGAPEDFDRTLGTLPEDVGIRRQARGSADLILLFSSSEAQLRRRFPAATRALADRGRLWLAWPKKASGVKTDLTQATVRALGLGHGLVDFKICAIDDTWSGLAFARRR